MGDTPPARRTALRGRGVVLGGGGLTGLAWLAGVLSELPAVVSTADRVIGTSAGALLAARLLGVGHDEGLASQIAALAEVRLGLGPVAALLGAQVWPSRRHALQWLGRRANRATAWSEDAFVGLVEQALESSQWPSSLIVAAVDADAGRPAYFTERSQVPLARAVAASCAMPGVFPPVRIDGRSYLDGGLRSPANVQLATGCARVLVLAPQWHSARAVRRPARQVDKLRQDGAEVVLLQATLSGVHTMSASALPHAREHGRVQGRGIAASVQALW